MRKVTHFQIERAGKGLDVSKIENFADVTNQDSAEPEYIPTTIEYVVEDGTHLMPLECGTFRIQETGEIVRQLL